MDNYEIAGVMKRQPMHSANKFRFIYDWILDANVHIHSEVVKFEVTIISGVKKLLKIQRCTQYY